MTTLLLSCENLSRGFDADPLFEDLSLEIYSSQRIGLVGPNGVGKTTLMNLLAGVDRPDTGEVRLHAGARVGLLRQQAEFVSGRTLFEEAKTGLDEILAAHDDMIRTAELLSQATDEAQRKSLAQRYDRLQELLHAEEAFAVDHRIEEVLQGLGFTPDDFGRAVETFSGGQQSRLMLAKMLLASPDVLLLDEPSNHLDIQTTRWLEDYLVRQSEGMLIVSHDRYFLNKVVTKVFELNDRRIETYVGNYDAYVRQRRERFELRLKTYEAQREEIARQEEYIRRVGYSRATLAQSRQKQLDKIERLERPTMIETPFMHFGEVRRSGDVVLDVQDLSKSYDRPLFRDLSFQVKRGQRLGILGPNGCGKTTLLRILLGDEKPDSGRADIGHLVKFGYYDQHLQTLPDDKTVIRAIWPPDDKDATEQSMRNLLGRFGLVGDQVYQAVGQLSGGERSRAALARLVALGVNVLILDEPTNHLDLWACDALEQALLDFEGTAICVSHDRYFLNRVVDLLLVFEGEGRVEVIFGNYDTYERMRLLKVDDDARAKKKEAAKAAPDAPPPAPTGKVKRKRKFTYRKVADLEADIAAEEGRLRNLEAALASPDLYREGGKVKETAQAFEDVKVRLAQLYEHWEEAVELN
jgi:ATP-binding cassette subfamily F protein 3